MSKSIKLKDNNYLDTSGMIYSKSNQLNMSYPYGTRWVLEDLYTLMHKRTKYRYDNHNVKNGDIWFHKVGAMVYFQSYSDAINVPNWTETEYVTISDDLKPVDDSTVIYPCWNTHEYLYLKIEGNKVYLGNYSGQSINSAHNFAVCGMYIADSY